MRHKLHIRAVLAGLALSVAATACATDNLTAPKAAPPQSSSSLLGGLVGGVVGVVGGTVGGVVNLVGSLLVPAVQRTATLPSDIVVQKTIDARGGSIAVPQAGMHITFAPGAVSAATTITVTAHAGDYVAYSFEPHGIQFSAPVVITQDMGSVNTAGINQLLGGYMSDGLSDLDPSTGNVTVSEQYPTTTTYGWGMNGRWQPITSFTIHHFSGYILTTGRE